MFSVLPDLPPRDSHSLWYTSSRKPVPAIANDAANRDPTAPPSTARRQNQATLERTPLARLRADEAYHERRKLNVSNFGATWLKPPGVAKSLFQMREERREQEEHAETLRREQLAQQLAEAEAGVDAGMDGVELDVDGEPMDADEGMAERDLDDEIPDADADGFGFDGADSSEEEASDLSAADDGGDATGTGSAAQRRELQHMRANEDRVRVMMARGQGDGQDMYGAEEDIDEEDQEQLLEEDDLVHGVQHNEVEPGMDMDMDADLDDDIPEAESGGYEHTDTEAELSSDDDDHERSVAAARAPQTSRFRGSLARSDRHSIDISSLLSRDDSSAIGSSPQIRRRP